MALPLIYLVFSKLLSWTMLRTRSDTAKEIEILVLRHQLAVLQRRSSSTADQPARCWIEPRSPLRSMLAARRPHPGLFVTRNPARPVNNTGVGARHASWRSGASGFTIAQLSLVQGSGPDRAHRRPTNRPRLPHADRDPPTADRH